MSFFLKKQNNPQKTSFFFSVTSYVFSNYMSNPINLEGKVQLQCSPIEWQREFTLSPKRLAEELLTDTPAAESCRLTLPDPGLHDLSPSAPAQSGEDNLSIVFLFLPSYSCSPRQENERKSLVS